MTLKCPFYCLNKKNWNFKRQSWVAGSWRSLNSHWIILWTLFFFFFPLKLAKYFVYSNIRNMKILSPQSHAYERVGNSFTRLSSVWLVYHSFLVHTIFSVVCLEKFFIISFFSYYFRFISWWAHADFFFSLSCSCSIVNRQTT